MSHFCPICPLRGDPEAAACYFVRADGSCDGPHSAALGGKPAGFPGLAAQAKNFLKAMRGLVADGGRLAPRAVRKARRATCQACPFHVAGPDSCAKCGCGSVVPGGLVAKLAIASSECPDDPPRWGPV